MRGLGSILLGALVGGFVAGTVQLQMAISFRSGEEFIGPMFLLMFSIIAAAVGFAIALVAGGGRRGVGLMAIAILAAVVLFCLAVEVLGQPFPPMLTRADAIVLGEILIPALLAVAIQWWFVQRHLKKAGVIAATARP